MRTARVARASRRARPRRTGLRPRARRAGGAFCSASPSCRSFPMPRCEDEEFDAEVLGRLSRAMAAEDCAAVLPDSARRPARPIARARSAPRLRDDAAAHAGVPSRRAGYRRDSGDRSRGRNGCGSRAAPRRRPPGRSAGDGAAPIGAAHRRAAARAGAVSGPRTSMPPPGRGIVDGGRPQRHGAAVRAQLRPGLLRARRAHVAAR